MTFVRLLYHRSIVTLLPGAAREQLRSLGSVHQEPFSDKDGGSRGRGRAGQAKD